MKKEKKNRNLLKAGVGTLFIIVIICGVYINYSYNNVLLDNYDSKDYDDIIVDDTIIIVDDDVFDDGTFWRMIARIYPLNPLGSPGEYNPGMGASGWLSFFCLDYAQDPNATLAVNTTNWNQSESNAMGFVNYKNFANTSLVSEDPFYFVCRCKFGPSAKEATQWNHSRYRVNLTISGDETISDVGESDNSSTHGDAVVSGYSTNNSEIYIAFYWDDASDGYRITDNGSLTISFTIWERY